MASTMFLTTRNRLLIGTCVEQTDGGWRFLPNIYGRQSSRRSWPSAVKSIPKWAFDMSDDLLTADEWRKGSN